MASKLSARVMTDEETGTQEEAVDSSTHQADNDNIAAVSDEPSFDQSNSTGLSDTSTFTTSDFSSNEATTSETKTREPLPPAADSPTKLTAVVPSDYTFSVSPVGSAWSGLEWFNSSPSQSTETLPDTVDGFETEYTRWHVLMKEKQRLSEKSLSATDTSDRQSLLTELKKEQIIVEQLVKEINKGPPARPSNVHVYPQQSNHAMRVEWDGPIWGISVPVDAYSVEVLKNDSYHWLYLDTVRPVSDRQCHYETDNLEPGTYTFRIIPFNDAGSGPPAISGSAEIN